ncbi:hypothetical protein L6R44_15125 [Enterobacter cloacae complex sp. ECC445]|uniref:hypothetical protein n=1 Tax=Enterobacter cloacae complex TaxID=354276 RepID=UPI00097CC075|nr:MULTISPECIES: hypothetical protein [Enterobacter cloacae complex]GJL42780.1 hypothetical protein TUM17577_39890 [Enterobacter asburiae]MBT1935479.1 hypothetical protein [Enterobacter chengduensis]MBT1963937.1 hypothetical protein [Enterobacter chengduensis]MCG0457410.1 hypothetical protein [Enterobacter cloacae complex sp. ECC445]MCK6820255.1 hypothetical protein [Enterobacter chengduensis]
MLTFSEEQCATTSQMEDDAFVRDTARKLKSQYPVIVESDDVFYPRLKAALAFANTIPIKEMKARRDFLFLEAFFVSFYCVPEADNWLRTSNGYSADQRLEDLKHILINREKRKSW